MTSVYFGKEDLKALQLNFQNCVAEGALQNCVAEGAFQNCVAEGPLLRCGFACFETTG